MYQILRFHMLYVIVVYVKYFKERDKAVSDHCHLTGILKGFAH